LTKCHIEMGVFLTKCHIEMEVPPPSGPSYMGERRTTFVKAYGIKSEVLWRTCWGTIHWEHEGNPLKT
jgi:hypothetical protein